MKKWRQQAESMCDWLDGMDDQLEALDTEEGDQSIKKIRQQLDECEVTQ